MSLRNPYGDFEITDPQAMKALAHPVRLAVLGRLQQHGPSTATNLADHVGASPSVTSWHLRHLASFGLVMETDAPEGAEDARRRWWRAVAKGIRFNMPAGPEGAAAGQELRTQFMAQGAAHAQNWVTEVAPVLEESWDRVAGLNNTRVRLTLAEARRLEKDIEALLAPYVTRSEEDIPRRARGVRMVMFTLPEAP